MGKSESSSSGRVHLPSQATRCHVSASELTSQAETPQRRSNRATKGTNSDRWQEVLDSAKHNFVTPESVAGDTATDAGTHVADARPQVQQDQADDDRIRCVCGQTEEIEDEDKDFVQCDQCQVWQHNQCVGLPAEIPETQDYFCEKCRPDLHQSLLRDMANGKFTKKPKVTKKTERKRKRVTTKANSSDDDHIHSENAILDEDDEDEITANSPKRQRSVSLSEASVVTVASETVQARTRKTSSKTSRNDTAQHGREDKQSGKSRSKASGKSKTGAASLGQPQVVEDIKDAERQKIAMALVKLVGDALNIAKGEEGFVLSGASNTEDTARRLGFQIEFALFDAHLDAKSKFRQLSFNLKDPKNPSLRKRVFDGSLLPADLVQMSSEDMANPELKAKTEALREESLKQSVLVQDTGPRLRRTHKGEEYVEGPESTPQVSLEISGSYSKPHIHEEDGDSPLSIRSPSASQSPISEHSRSPVVVRRERSGSNFNIKNVWNHIETPVDSESPAQRPRQTSQSAPVQADDNDEDLLGLLEGEGKVDPNRYDYDSKAAVWQGQLLMPGISDFNAKASLVGGPKSFQMDWSEAFSTCIQIDGRIAKPDATKYLCHQKFSHSKSVFAVHFEANDGKDASLKALYDYFTNKDRFGVIKPGKTRLRDGYIVPLPASAPLPEFITMLPNHNLPSDRSNMLLALLVIEKTGPKIEPPGIAAQLPAVHEVEESRYSPLKQIPTPSLPPPLPASHSAQWQPPIQQPSVYPQPTPQPAPSPHFQHNFPEEDPYMRRVQMTMAMANPAPPPPAQPQQPQLDPNAQAILAAFLRAYPDIANNKQVTSSPQLMGTLLEEFVRGLQNR